MPHTLLTSVLDFLFPPSSDARRVRALPAEAFTSRIHVRNINSAYALLSYRDADVRAVIHEAKYHHNPKALALLGKVLETYLRENDFKNAVLVPIPMHRTRYRERGYNQVTEILKALPNADQYTLCEQALSRTRNTPRQTDRSRYERLTNIKDAFVAHPKHIPDTETLILIDDVTTTGATLREARETLSSACHKDIVCIALAH